MRKELQYAFDSRIEDFGVTLSVGVSLLFPKDGTDYEELFRKADKCLYLAKEKGRNRFIIYNESKHGSRRIIAGIFIKFLICLIIQNIRPGGI